MINLNDEMTNSVLDFCEKNNYVLVWNTFRSTIGIVESNRVMSPLVKINVEEGEFLTKLKVKKDLIFNMEFYGMGEKWNSFILICLLKKYKSESNLDIIMKNLDNIIDNNSSRNMKNYLNLVLSIKENINEEMAILFFDSMPKKYIDTSYRNKDVLIELFNKITETFNTFNNNNSKQRVFNFLKINSRVNEIKLIAVRDALLEYYNYDKEKLSTFKKLVPSLGDYFNTSLEEVFYEKDNTKNIITILSLDKINGMLAIPLWDNDCYVNALNGILNEFKKQNLMVKGILTNKYKENKSSFFHIMIKCDKEDDLISKEEVNNILKSFLKDIPNHIVKNDNSVTPRRGNLEEEFYNKWFKKYNLEKNLSVTKTKNKSVNKI